ncbi:hypothetical protein J3F83DRAFT_736791 [Trichoderma novae-zelandiae]
MRFSIPLKTPLASRRLHPWTRWHAGSICLLVTRRETRGKGQQGISAVSASMPAAKRITRQTQEQHGPQQYAYHGSLQSQPVDRLIPQIRRKSIHTAVLCMYEGGSHPSPQRKSLRLLHAHRKPAQPEPIRIPTTRDFFTLPPLANFILPPFIQSLLLSCWCVCVCVGLLSGQAPSLDRISALCSITFDALAPSLIGFLQSPTRHCPFCLVIGRCGVPTCGIHSLYMQNRCRQSHGISV